MKRVSLLLFSVLLLLSLSASSGTPTVPIAPVVDNTPASMTAEQYIAVNGSAWGYGAFTETGDYTNTWFDDGSNYYASDSLTLYMLFVMQLDDLEAVDYDYITLNANWRFTSSYSNSAWWEICYPNGTLLSGHSADYIYTGTDSGTIDTSVEIDMTDAIEAQNSTGYIGFVMYAGGVNTYALYCDFAYIERGYDYNFTETLPDDTYYTPDPTQFKAVYGYGEGIGAFTETNDYTDSQINDGTYWYVSDSAAVYMRMFMQMPDLSKFDVMVFHADWRATASSSDTLNWMIGDGDGDIIAAYNNIYEYTGTDSGYETVSVEILIDATLIAEQNSTGYLSFLMEGVGFYTYGLYCDYACIELYRNDTGYVESFADVSDCVFGWDGYMDPADSSFTTDYDVGELEAIYDEAGYYEYCYYNICTTDYAVDSYSSYYFEWRYKVEDASESYLGFRIYYTDLTNDWIDDYEASESWDTTKVRIGDVADSGKTIDNVVVKATEAGIDKAGTWSHYIDYFRISPADEMGWQHDGSTTQGVSTGSGGSISVISGDVINCSSTVAGREFRFDIDTTSTVALSENDYYQFLEICINEVSDGDGDNLVWRPRITDGSTYEYLSSSLSTTGIHRYNVKASTVATIKYIYLYIDDDSDWFSLDYVKLYSIANFTVTQSSTTVDDIVYVDDHGVLTSDMSSGYFILEYDPLYENVTDNLQWNKTTDTGDSYVSFQYGGWTDYDDNTNGALYGDTLTGLRIKFNESANIKVITWASIPPQWNAYPEVIIEFDLPEWISFEEVIIYIYVAIGQSMIDYILMFAGLILIPASTLYLVHGGRENMSTDKILIFLLVFFMGIGLFIGGLLI